MKPIKCELCGSTELTKVNGYFKCTFCGTNYTLEEAQKLIVSGTVEFVKSEAEKNRLFKKAETFFNLSDIIKAKTIYKQLTEEYPDDSMCWMNLAECYFFLLPKEYAKDELPHANVEVSEIYYELVDIQKKAIMLDYKLQSKFNDLWKKHDAKNISYGNELINRYKNNDCFDDVLLIVLDYNSYITRVIEKILLIFRDNALQFEKKISTPICLSRICNICSKCYKKEYGQINNIEPSMIERIDHIEYLTPCEAIVSNNIHGIKKNFYIQFSKKYSIAELIDVVLTPTNIEHQQIGNLQIIKEIFSNISHPLKVELIKYMVSILQGRDLSTENDEYSRTTIDIYNIRINLNTEIMVQEPMLTIIYDYSLNEYYKTINSYKTSKLTDIKLVLKGSKYELDMIKTWCINKGLCANCGGRFGLFTKVCTKCKKAKDY